MNAYQNLKRKLDTGGIAILDGATGTELQQRGVSMNPQAWCGPATLQHDALLTQIHIDYINAGSEVITANTYASSRLLLEPAGFGGQVNEINHRAVEAALKARDATHPDVAVAGSMSHEVSLLGDDSGDGQHTHPSDNKISDAFHELAHIHKEAGVDFIMLEMMCEPQRVTLAVEAALSTGLPVWFGLSAKAGVNGELLCFPQSEDIPIAELLNLIPTQGIDVAGPMHTRADLVEPILKELPKYFSGPRMAYPDSGHFEMPDWVFRDVLAPQDLETYFMTWLAHDVQAIGGCCGLTVRHIEAAVQARERYLI